MKQSAGILLFQKNPLRFFLVHPGGPFWKNKDIGAWSIPKGEFDDSEEPLYAAIREFNEETGYTLARDADYKKLDPVVLKSKKTVHAWALERYIDADHISSNTFEIEWPPKSGRKIEIPEVDKAAWFALEEALIKIKEAQAGLLRQIESFLAI